MTKQQELIYRLVASSTMHPTAEEVYETAKGILPSIGLATVYRNLNRLSEEGRIRRISVNGSNDHFDKTLYPHEHALCRKCGSMRDVDVGPIYRQISEHLHTNDFTYELCIHDCCPKCRAADADVYDK